MFKKETYSKFTFLSPDDFASKINIELLVYMVYSNGEESF